MFRSIFGTLPLSPERRRDGIQRRRMAVLAVSLLVVPVILGFAAWFDRKEVCQETHSKEECRGKTLWLVGAGVVPFSISLTSMCFLSKIRSSRASTAFNTKVALSFFLLSQGSSLMTHWAFPSHTWGLITSCAYMIWGFLLEAGLGLATPIGLVASWNQLANGFVKGLVEHKSNHNLWFALAANIPLACTLLVLTWTLVPVYLPVTVPAGGGGGGGGGPPVISLQELFGQDEEVLVQEEDVEDGIHLHPA